MLPDMAPVDAFERLRALPFFETARDGLIVHEAVQPSPPRYVPAEPCCYREYRRRAWRELRAEVEQAGRSEPWRYTADMLYLLENPEVHEVFFPSGASDVAIETASAVDEPEIRAIGGTPCGPGGPNLSARRRRLFRAQCASHAPGSRQLPGSSCYCSSSS